MHISFIVGVIVIGVFLIDGLIKYKNNLFHNDIRTLGVVLFLSILVTIVNPNGISGAIYPFTLFQNYGYSIEENQSIFFLWQHFKKPTLPWFGLGVALLFTTLILNVKRSKPIDWLLAIFLSILAAIFVRNLPLFALGTFIPFANNLSLLFAKVRSSSKLHLVARVSALIIVLLILQHLGKTTAERKVGFGVPKGVGQAVDFFLENKLEGPIFNNFDIGSQLAYHLYPKEKVFVDGRPEAYPTSFFQDVYLPMHTDENIFDRFINLYKVNVIIFSHTDQTPWADVFLRRLMDDPNWKLIFLDDAAVILVKNDHRNKEVIDRFSMNKNSVYISGFESFNEFSLLYLTRLFRRVAWKNQERRVLERLLTTNPQSCIALRGLSRLEENEQVSLAYESRYRTLCQ